MTDLIDIYHGSDHIIEQPVQGEGKVHNDYGRGFYCTEHVELAKEWACSADNDGYIRHSQKQLEKWPEPIRKPISTQPCATLP